MRGSPLLRAVLAFLVLLSLAYPLHRLTRADAETAAVLAPTGTPEKTVRLQIAFTSVPQSLRVLHLGKEIWHPTELSKEVSQQVQLAYPAEGVDLQFQAEFPAGTPLTALRVRLTDPAGDDHEKSLWGEAHIDEVLTFP